MSGLRNKGLFNDVTHVAYDEAAEIPAEALESLDTRPAFDPDNYIATLTRYEKRAQHAEAEAARLRVENAALQGFKLGAFLAVIHDNPDAVQIETKTNVERDETQVILAIKPVMSLLAVSSYQLAQEHTNAEWLRKLADLFTQSLAKEIPKRLSVISGKKGGA